MTGSYVYSRMVVQAPQDAVPIPNPNPYTIPVRHPVQLVPRCTVTHVPTIIHLHAPHRIWGSTSHRTKDILLVSEVWGFHVEWYEPSTGRLCYEAAHSTIHLHIPRVRSIEHGMGAERRRVHTSVGAKNKLAIELRKDALLMGR